MHGRLAVCTGAAGVRVENRSDGSTGLVRTGPYGSTRAAPCCGVVGMWARPMRLRNTQYVHAW